MYVVYGVLLVLFLVLLFGRVCEVVFGKGGRGIDKVFEVEEGMRVVLGLMIGLLVILGVVSVVLMIVGLLLVLIIVK